VAIFQLDADASWVRVGLGGQEGASAGSDATLEGGERVVLGEEFMEEPLAVGRGADGESAETSRGKGRIGASEGSEGIVQRFLLILV